MSVDLLYGTGGTAVQRFRNDSDLGSQVRALQMKDTLEDLYVAAHRVMPRFRVFMEDVATRSRAMEGSGVAPLKSMCVLERCFEEHTSVVHCKKDGCLFDCWRRWSNGDAFCCVAFMLHPGIGL